MRKRERDREKEKARKGERIASPGLTGRAAGSRVVTFSNVSLLLN